MSFALNFSEAAMSRFSYRKCVVFYCRGRNLGILKQTSEVIRHFQHYILRTFHNQLIILILNGHNRCSRAVRPPRVLYGRKHLK